MTVSAKKFAPRYISKNASTPKNKAYNMHFFVASFLFLPLAISSDITLVDARFIPDDETVTPKVYTDIISANNPIPDEPILFAIYTLKEKLTARINSETAVRITAFFINCFFKLSPRNATD